MIALIIYLVLLGVIFGLIEQIPMEPVFYTIIKVVAVVIAIVLILNFFGVSTGLPTLR